MSLLKWLLKLNYEFIAFILYSWLSWNWIDFASVWIFLIQIIYIFNNNNKRFKSKKCAGKLWTSDFELQKKQNVSCRVATCNCIQMLWYHKPHKTDLVKPPVWNYSLLKYPRGYSCFACTVIEWSFMEKQNRWNAWCTL